MAQQPIRVQTFLANLPLFKELSAEEIDRVAQHTRQMRYERGEPLFHRGEPVTGFYLVVYGQVKLAFVTQSGSEKVVELLGPGQSFGEAVMFTDRPHVVSAQALADSLVLHVGKEAVLDEIERDPRFARRMLAGMARRLHQLMADVEAYSTQSGTERVIGYLLSCNGGVDPEAASAQVTLPATKGIIASRLNLTQEHFSRILHELAEAGLIRVEGRNVQIPDCGRLRGWQR